MVWSPDGASLASGSRDYTVKIWNVKTGKCDSTSRHIDPVFSVFFSPCGTKICSSGGARKDEAPDVGGGNEDFSIRIWDAETGSQSGSPLSGQVYRSKLVAGALLVPVHVLVPAALVVLTTLTTLNPPYNYPPPHPPRPRPPRPPSPQQLGWH